MTTAAIICEYNPFHLGHKHHIAETRRITGAQCIVAIMSGSFVQRGEPAIADIETRAQWALAGGADLVVELPYAYACSGAEIFAYGGCQIATMLGVDYLSFGAENPDVSDLRKLALLLVKEPQEYVVVLKAELDKGVPFAKARQIAIASCCGQEQAALLDNPNNILGIEYLKALIKLEMGGHKVPEAVAIKRIGAPHGSKDDQFYSATAARIHMDSSLKSVNGVDDFSMPIISAIRRMSPEEIALYGDMEQGLENRIKAMAEDCIKVSELVAKVANKRITEARVRRILCNILTGETGEMRQAAVDKGPYLRAVAMGPEGRVFLREYDGETPVFTRIKDVDKFCHKNGNPNFLIEKRAQEQYSLARMTKSN